MLFTYINIYFIKASIHHLSQGVHSISRYRSGWPERPVLLADPWPD